MKELLSTPVVVPLWLYAFGYLYVMLCLITWALRGIVWAFKSYIRNIEAEIVRLQGWHT